MPTLIVKVTLLFLTTLTLLFAVKRSTAAMRHLLCVCTLAGSLVLPLTALLPARVIAVRLPTIAIAASQAVARAESWSPSRVILGLWAFGGLVLILRRAVGHWRISRLVRAATPIKPGELFLADVNVPIVCGLLRPVVLMPRSAPEWPEWQFEAAVRHEWTHVRRKDLWTNIVADAACAVWWFHPLAWMLSRRLCESQETACDDAVLFSGFEPATYAQALLSVAQTVAQTPTPALLPGCPMTNETTLKTRIARLLDRSIPRNTSRAEMIRLAVCFAVVLALLGVLSLPKSSAQTPSADKSDQANKDQVYSVGGDVTSPSVISKVDPDYTEDARKEKIAGSVLLSMVIGTDGMAHEISVTRSLDPGLDRKAAEAVEQWHFAPGTLNGEPVAVRAVVEVNFKLL